MGAHNCVFGDNLSNRVPDIGAILQSSNLYAYVTNNPLRYIDYDGFARIDTPYTYTYTTISDQERAMEQSARERGGRIPGGPNREHHVVQMTRVEFTNLNTVVYTIDGVLFRTSAAHLK